MLAPISTTNGAFFTPRFFCPGILRVENENSDGLHAAGELTRLVQLLVQA